MSGTGDPGAPPPEVPEEFADAYRAAYEQAMGPERTPPAGSHRADVEDVPAPAMRVRADVLRERFLALREHRWLRPLLAVLVAVLLVLVAYVVGRALSGGHSAAGPTGKQGHSKTHTKGHTSGATSSTSAKAWHGAVRPVTAKAAQATCTAKPGVDSGGHQVRYAVANVLDSDPATAWRCDGPATGQVLTFTLPSPTAVGEVGLIPGYAKTDPVSHADRYAQNNRITEVRWTIGDTTVVQRMAGGAHDRSLRTIRVPRTSTSSISLEILRVHKGPRDTTAISTVQIAAAGS
ncbi:NADase-type glycan-binding domain-containing protein [Nocardioides terrisoli]|uniref:NADase-type glycan-binding domain-containing protein n=1 Tax=Nocardioides terrisoli TaxID=3388267 RepID=UPI00287BB832|nr:hypothetical protein [Nocardioides marmorisolisilvae]